MALQHKSNKKDSLNENYDEEKFIVYIEFTEQNAGHENDENAIDF